MTAEKKVGIICFVSATLNFLGIVSAWRPAGSLWLQAMIYSPLLFGSLSLLYFFSKGENWARILFLIGAFFGLLNFAAIFSATTLLQALILFLSGCFSIYLIVTLLQKDMKEFFAARSAQNKKGLLFFILSLVLILAVEAGIGMLGLGGMKKRIASTQIWLEDFKTGQATKLTNEGVNVQPRFSHDNSKIVFASRKTLDGREGSEIRVYSLKDQSISTVVEDPGLLNYPSWGAGDQSLLFSKGDPKTSNLWIYDFSTQALRQRTQNSQSHTEGQVSPDGKWIASLEGEEGKGIRLYLYPFAEGEKKPLMQNENFLYQPRGLAWSPDSQKVAYVSFTELIVQNISTGTKDAVSLAGLNNMKPVLFHPQNPDLVLVRAKPADQMSMRFDLYWVSAKEQKIELVKSGRDLTEMYYDLSSDGTKLIYSRP